MEFQRANARGGRVHGLDDAQIDDDAARPGARRHAIGRGAVHLGALYLCLPEIVMTDNRSASTFAA